MSAVFRIAAGDDVWSPLFTLEQLGKWRIRKAPEGALPPWRSGPVPDEVVRTEDHKTPEHVASWWVFPPGGWSPTATSSEWAAAMRYVVDEELSRMIRSELEELKAAVTPGQLRGAPHFMPKNAEGKQQ